MGNMRELLDKIGKDKYQHAVVSALICAVLKCVLGLPLAVILTLIVGVGKEIWDKKSYGKADFRDILADVVGTIIGAL